MALKFPQLLIGKKTKETNRQSKSTPMLGKPRKSWLSTPQNKCLGNDGAFHTTTPSGKSTQEKNTSEHHSRPDSDLFDWLEIPMPYSLIFAPWPWMRSKQLRSISGQTFLWNQQYILRPYRALLSMVLWEKKESYRCLNMSGKYSHSCNRSPNMGP